MNPNGTKQRWRQLWHEWPGKQPGAGKAATATAFRGWVLDHHPHTPAPFEQGEANATLGAWVGEWLRVTPSTV